jgi:hypothetical protein
MPRSIVGIFVQTVNAQGTPDERKTNPTLHPPAVRSNSRPTQWTDAWNLVRTQNSLRCCI